MNLKTRYNKEIKDQLMSKFSYKSTMEIPKLEKVVINMGLKDAVTNSKVVEEVSKELALLSGQKPLTTKAKKSIASFKLREGMPLGVKVDLRGEKMYEFVEKLITIALPRVRDFKGVSKTSFDGKGNYSLGIKEHIIFPEIEIDKVKKIRGMDIIIVTTAKSDDEARELLKCMGMPFKK